MPGNGLEFQYTKTYDTLTAEEYRRLREKTDDTHIVATFNTVDTPMARRRGMIR